MYDSGDNSKAPARCRVIGHIAFNACARFLLPSWQRPRHAWFSTSEHNLAHPAASPLSQVFVTVSPHATPLPVQRISRIARASVAVPGFYPSPSFSARYNCPDGQENRRTSTAVQKRAQTPRSGVRLHRQFSTKAFQAARVFTGFSANRLPACDKLFVFCFLDPSLGQSRKNVVLPRALILFVQPAGGSPMIVYVCLGSQDFLANVRSSTANQNPAELQFLGVHLLGP